MRKHNEIRYHNKYMKKYFFDNHCKILFSNQKMISKGKNINIENPHISNKQEKKNKKKELRKIVKVGNQYADIPSDVERFILHLNEDKKREFLENNGYMIHPDKYLPKVGQYVYDRKSWKNRKQPYDFINYVDMNYALIEHGKEGLKRKCIYYLRMFLLFNDSPKHVRIYPSMDIQLGAFLDNIVKYPLIFSKVLLNKKPLTEENLGKTIKQLEREKILEQDPWKYDSIRIITPDFESNNKKNRK